MKIIHCLYSVIITAYYCIVFKISGKADIKLSVKLNRNKMFEGCNVVHRRTAIRNTRIGYGSYIGSNCLLQYALIGRYCSIAENVQVITATHPTKEFVSTHPAFFSIKKQAGFTFVSKPLFNELLVINGNYSIIIGNDVWIGRDVKLKGGIRIGDGAIIAMGSIVTKNVEPYSIVGGVPAKLIRFRFAKEQIDFLSSFKWWDKDQFWIRQNIEKFSKISLFIKHFQN